MTGDGTRRFLANATVIDGVGDQALPAHTVVLRGEQIDWVGPAAAAPAARQGDIVHDLTGSTVLPGFIDAHTHLSFSADLNPANALHEPETIGYYRSVPNMSATLDAGVTTVRDLGGIDYAAVLAVERGLVRGPRIVTAVHVLGPTAGHGDWRYLNVPYGRSGNEEWSMLGRRADGPVECRRAARELLRVGAGVIKVMASGGVWSPRDAPDQRGFTLEEMAAVVDEASNRGVYVAAHAQGAAGIENALRAGVMSIEHGYLLDDECIQLMLETGAWLVPTLLTHTTPPDPAKASSYGYEKKIRVVEQARGKLARAIAAGVRIGLGTDSGAEPHGQNLREIGLMVDYGLSPMAAIKAGTSSNAELLGMLDRCGTLTAGKRADVVVTSVDPLANPHGLGEPHAISSVFQGGEPVKQSPSPGLAPRHVLTPEKETPTP